VRDPPRQARSISTHPRQTKESPARRYDHIHDVLAAALSVRIDREWTQAPRGSCILIPGGAPHDAENRDMAECSFLCINAPAGFERKMPGLVAWFAENPPGDARADRAGPIEPRQRPRTTFTGRRTPTARYCSGRDVNVYIMAPPRPDRPQLR
jgi:hypothetical protein